MHINNVYPQGDVLLEKSMYGTFGTKSMEDILEGLRDEDDRMLSPKPTPQLPADHGKVD